MITVINIGTDLGSVGMVEFHKPFDQITSKEVRAEAEKHFNTKKLDLQGWAEVFLDNKTIVSFQIQKHGIIEKVTFDKKITPAEIDEYFEKSCGGVFAWWKKSWLFDVHNADLYEYNKPTEQTRKRLIEMAEIGMKMVGTAQFGVESVMSGFFIEEVWIYSDEKFSDKIEWVKGLIQKSQSRKTKN